MREQPKTLRIAAVADLHHTKKSDSLGWLFQQVAQRADVLLLCGDLTDYGLVDEAESFAKDLVTVPIPILAVLGNHDVESSQQDAIRSLLEQAQVRVLDGEVWELEGVGFAGVKGFAGGFGRHALEPWGETVVKEFVRESVDEALKLERALARLRTPRRIALLHYSPIVETVVGEPQEIFTFLGSSRLEEPLNRYEVTAAFHGHAHRGAAEGRTQSGIPVYNVSLPLLRRTYNADFPVRMIEVPLED